MKKNLKIAVSGKSGCGNTTVSNLVAKRLGFRLINFTFRNLAKEKGMRFEDLLALAELDNVWDEEIDTRQVHLAREPGGCVLGSRLAIWMLPEADIKVYLTALPETRAARIFQREGVGCLEEVAAFTAERDFHDRMRYLHLYDIDNDNYEFADLIIGTDILTPVEIADIIIEAAEKIRA